MRSNAFITCMQVGLMLSGPAVAISADTAPQRSTTASDPKGVLSEAEKSLLLQLSDAEANIKALNIALARTGYKVGQAYNRIDAGQKGNELMDRKAGGPVGWKDFYGKTARDFIVPDSETSVHVQGGGRPTVDIHSTSGNHPIQRPTQFDFVYRANNDQVARAKEQVASLAQDQATLLGRRQKHEADQSRLWAMLAFTRVADREISDEPLCRFKLKSSDNAAGSRVQILRAIILFLRTADQAAVETLEYVKVDQAAAFGDLDLRMKSAYATLRASLADAMLGSDLKPEDKKAAEALKAICKQLWDESSIVADNYRNALDRDQAKEDNSKLVFREKLQESLAKFSAMTAELDVQAAHTAATWNIGAQNGIATSDALPPSIAHGATAQRDFRAAPVMPLKARPTDLLQPGTLWLQVGTGAKLSVFEREGDRIKAKFYVGPRNTRLISGYVRDGKFWWLAKDVVVITGGPGGDNTGVINGDEINFEWHSETNKGGTFIMRLDKSTLPK